MNMNIKTTTILALLIGALCSHADAIRMESDFANPPETSKPWCYWYWLGQDITKDGITKDLEAMAKVGISRAMIGNIGGPKDSVGVAPGNVRMFSEEWYALTRHAFSEAQRVGVTLYMFNSPGWSQSGGPWIKPEQSMRRVTWREFSSEGGACSQKVRPEGIAASQDIAVLALPRLDAVSIVGTSVPVGMGSGPSLAKAQWIWCKEENGAVSAPAATRYFRRVFSANPARIASADITVTADNTYVLTINGRQILKDDNWMTQESASIKDFLKAGANTIEIAVTNTEVSPAGLIAAAEFKDLSGKVQLLGTDQSWHASTDRSKGLNPAQVLGGMNMMPWALATAAPGGMALTFKHTSPFTARALVVHGKTRGKLYALQDGQRKLVAEINANGGSGRTDFLPNAIETFSFADVTASEFRLIPAAGCKVVLTSEPKVAQVIEKQMGRVHPTPTPTWTSYIFPDSVEPEDRSSVIRQKEIINLTDKLNTEGMLRCTLPKGKWDIIYFGMVSTGVKNSPSPDDGIGLEVDKMSRKHTEYHFNSMFGKLLKDMTPREKEAFKGITIDSYEKGAQNWTDGFDAEFEKRNGYNPITLLPVMTGRVLDSAKQSDQFLWDLRRTVADMIAENYVDGLRDIANRNGLRLWCENYGHWGFPGEFLIYGAYSDEIGGEFWSTGSLGDIECRAASSASHIYGKRRVFAEAYTSSLQLGHHPYIFKARGEQMFCKGINHFVLHVYAHQPRDGVPGRNPWFGTAFHRNTPWFMESRDWVKYLQRCHTMLQQGTPQADVAVYIGDFAPQMTGPSNPLPDGYDYDYIGSDAILRKLDVVDGEWVVYDENDSERIAARWQLLAMPKLKYVRPHVLARLDHLKAKGGRTVDGVPVSPAVLQNAGIKPMVSDTSCAIRWKARQLDDGTSFFLSNFGKTGTFEATLRVNGKAPELFNPLTGEITRLARFKSVPGGTRITVDVKDRADSFFVVFREPVSYPSVVGASAPPASLALFYDEDDRLIAESCKAGVYTLSMSNGTKRNVVIKQDSRTFVIKTPWQTNQQDANGYSVLKETKFDVPAGFGTGQRVVLNLGKVEVMAKVALNGKCYDTLWMPPFELDVTDAVKPGQNALKILVTSTSTGQPKLGDAVQLRTITRL
jgi:hypothetical protein